MKLVVPFPTQEPLFAVAVAWEMFRQRLMSESKAFDEVVPEAHFDWFVELAEMYGREVSEAPKNDTYWKLLKVNASPLEGIEP